MNVLIVMNSLGTGGAERSMAELLPALKADGIEPVVVCLEHRALGVEQAVLKEEYDIRFLDPTNRFGLLKPLAKPDRLVQQVRALRRIIRDVQPEVVHTVLFEASLVGRLSAAGTGVPLITSIVNTPYEPIRVANDPNLVSWKMDVLKRVDGWFARRMTTHLHAITEAVKSATVRDFRVSPQDVTVVERGRHPERLGRRTAERRRNVREAYGFEEHHEVILNVGRQEFQKGQKFLLEAAEVLLAERPSLVVLIAGREGNATAELEALHRQMEYGDRVRFLDHVDDVPGLMAAADVFAFPSLFEGLGGSLIEALALELPIVAGDVPAVREVTDDGRLAWLVPAADATALATALREALDDPEGRNRRAEAGRRRFESTYTHARSTERMIALYRNIAEQGRG